MSDPVQLSPVRADSPVQRIPVILLTGFLGSGKTTLLRELLREPAWSDTAVLVNELGAVGLDHQLVWGASGTTLVLENGCICCSARDDLVSALETLFWQRLHRKIPRFARVIIETTGLANPGPIIRELFSHLLVAERYQLQSVITTADAVLGDAQLGQHPESLQQAASADVMIMTKTDLATPDGANALEARLRQINPMALFTRAVAGAIAPEVWQRMLSPRVPAKRFAARFPVAIKSAALQPGRPQSPPLYHARMQTTVLQFDRAWQGFALQRALRETVAFFGERILRIKGMAALEGEPRPLLVQVVQTMVFPFERLPLHMEDEASSFLVFITMELAAETVQAYFLEALSKVRADDSPGTAS